MANTTYLGTVAVIELSEDGPKMRVRKLGEIPNEEASTEAEE